MSLIPRFPREFSLFAGCNFGGLQENSSDTRAVWDQVADDDFPRAGI
jgi:hypothetical protein